MISHHGRDDAKTWLTGVKNNLARRPQGNDRAQVKAIKDGLCDVALGNNYYFGKMMSDPSNALGPKPFMSLSQTSRIAVRTCEYLWHGDGKART